MEECAQYIKGRILQSLGHILNGEKLKEFLQTSRKRQGCPLSPLPMSIAGKNMSVLGSQ